VQTRVALPQKLRQSTKIGVKNDMRSNESHREITSGHFLKVHRCYTRFACWHIFTQNN